MGEIKAPAIDFGVLIAYIAPGFLALVALSWISPVVKEWLVAAGDKQQNIGVFLFAALAALSMGLAVGGLRNLLVDPFFWRWARYCGPLGHFALTEPQIAWADLPADRMSKLVLIRDSYFWYYQFYANMAVALALWVFVRGLSGAYDAVRWFHLPLHVLGIVLLLASSHRSLTRYCDGVSALKGP